MNNKEIKKYIKDNQVILCAICNKPIMYFNSHNMAPFSTKLGNRCCEECNYKYIIPKRLELTKEYEAHKNETKILIMDDIIEDKFNIDAEKDLEEFYKLYNDRLNKNGD